MSTCWIVTGLDASSAGTIVNEVEEAHEVADEASRSCNACGYLVWEWQDVGQPKLLMMYVEGNGYLPDELADGFLALHGVIRHTGI